MCLMSCFVTNRVQSLSVILALSCICRWHHQPTTGEPPLGVLGYACDNINNDIYYFAGYCGHDKCRHNTLNILHVDDFTWKNVYPGSDSTGPMRKGDCAMLSFENQLLAVGGVGNSLPADPSPSATYEKKGAYIYTNEHHIYDTEGG